MSADDWEPCPFCTKQINEEISEIENQTKESYDKLTAKEYDILKTENNNKINDLETKKVELSLRIDGMGNWWFCSSGKFHINISAYCPHCGRRWNIKNEVEPVERK